MAFKMNKNKPGSLYKKSVHRNNTVYKKVTGDETTYVPPRGYRPDAQGMEKFPEITYHKKKDLKRGWKKHGEGKGEYFTFQGNVVDNPDMKDVYSTSIVEALSHDGVGVSDKDKATMALPQVYKDKESMKADIRSRATGQQN